MLFISYTNPIFRSELMLLNLTLLRSDRLAKYDLNGIFSAFGPKLRTTTILLYP